MTQANGHAGGGGTDSGSGGSGGSGIRVFETLHVLSLAIWLAAVVGAGLAAAVVFPVMKQLDPRLPEFAASPADHWLIAGGHVGRMVFGIADRVQPVCVVAAVVTLAAITRLRGVSRPWLAVRWTLVSAAGGLAITAGLWLSPRMDEKLLAYWDAARAGNLTEAASNKAAFDADHPKASRVLTMTAGAVLLAVGAASASRRS